MVEFVRREGKRETGFQVSWMLTMERYRTGPVPDLRWELRIEKKRELRSTMGTISAAESESPRLHKSREQASEPDKVSGLEVAQRPQCWPTWHSGPYVMLRPKP